MPRTITQTLGAVSLAFLTGLSGALHAMEPDGYEVDSIFDLKAVGDVSLDGEAGRIVVTLPNKVLQFSTFPLNVKADVDVSIEGITSVMTKDQTLVVLGDDVDRGRSGGSILIYKNAGRTMRSAIDPISYELDVTPFSQTLLVDDDKLYAVNPTWFSILQMSVKNMIDAWETPEKGPFRTNDLFLKCGTASAVSVFTHNEQDFYVTSVTGTKLIEYGPVKPNRQKLPDSDCFASVSSGISAVKTKRATSQQAVLHDLIDNPWGGYDQAQVAKQVLIFDPDANDVSVFPFRGSGKTLTMLRSESFSLDLTRAFDEAGVPSGKFGLMAASADGSVIFLSHVGSTALHRLAREDRSLVYLGRTDLEKPLKLIEVSDDGRLAAAVVGDSRRGMPEEIIVIQSPRNIEGSGRLTRKRFSVLNMQKMLVEQGYGLAVDGIYGEQTQRAVDSFLIDQNKSQAESGAENRLRIPAARPSISSTVTQQRAAPTRSVTAQTATRRRADGTVAGTAVTRPTVSAPSVRIISNAPEGRTINRNLRGLFPLTNYGPSR